MKDGNLRLYGRRSSVLAISDKVTSSALHIQGDNPGWTISTWSAFSRQLAHRTSLWKTFGDGDTRNPVLSIFYAMVGFTYS